MPTRDFVLSHGDTPKSLNAGGAGSRAHWGVAHRQKKEWQGIWLAELLRLKVPKGMQEARLCAVMRFRTKHRHDVDNYIPGLLKPLQDVLVKGGYLADDTAEFLVFTGLQFEKREWPKLAPHAPRTAGETEVRITAKYAGDQNPTRKTVRKVLGHSRDGWDV